MAGKDVNIPIKAEGAEQATDKIDRLTGAIEKMTQKIDGQAGKARSNATAMEGLTGRLGSLLAQYVSVTAAIGLATKAIQEQTQAMRENAAIAERQQNSLLRLQFLGDLFAEHPELRKEVGAMAEFGRRPFEQVAGAWYNLRSKSAGMSDAQQMGILREALEMGRTDPSLPLDTLVDMFSLYAKQSGVADANRIQNVLQQTITDAGGSGADVARYMPQFLSVGMSGGLSAAQSAGLWAYATTQTADASIATTGLRATFMGLQGKGSPEGQKRLAAMGVTPEMDFFEKMNILSGAGLSLADAEQIAGREGAPLFLSLLKNQAAMMRTLGTVTGADRGDIDLTRTKIDQLFGSDAVAKWEEDQRLMNIRLANLRAGDAKSMRLQQIKREHELRLRGEGASEYRIGFELGTIESLAGAGLSPEHALTVGSSLINEDWKMNLFGAAGPLYRISQEWNNAPVIVNNNNTILNRSEGQASPRVDY